MGRTPDDGLTAKAPVLARHSDFVELIAAGEDEAMSRRLRQAETIAGCWARKAWIGPIGLMSSAR
jgi:hypothetical protein